MARPRVSVGLPVRNGERYLPRALDALLAQDYEDLEVVISDNASSDATPEICLEYARRDHRVRYHRNREDVGAARNYNRVFRLSRGELFKWAAHDDWCDPTFLTRCARALDEDPQAVLCASGVVFTDGSGRVVPYREWAGIPTRYRPRPLEGLGSAGHRRRLHTLLWSPAGPSPLVFGLVRTEALARTRLIRNVAEPDQVLLAELCLYGRFTYVSEALLFRGPPGHLHRDGWTWLDPTNAGRRRLASGRIAYHHVEAIVRSPHPAHDKMIMTADALAAVAVQRPRIRTRLWWEGTARRRATARGRPPVGNEPPSRRPQG